MSAIRDRVRLVVKRYLPDDAVRGLLRDLATEGADALSSWILEEQRRRTGVRPSAANDINPESVSEVDMARARVALDRAGIR